MKQEATSSSLILYNEERNILKEMKKNNLEIVSVYRVIYDDQEI